MTKLMIVSDLHLEFEYKDLDTLDADILVIAGDLCLWTMDHVLDRFFSNIKIPVVYVPGNHEYYNGSINDKYGHSNVFIINNTFVELDGIKFAGSTYWSNPSEYSFRQINDKFIRGLNIWDQHETDMQFMNSGFNADVIVTHFSPSKRSVSSQYITSLLNDYFINESEDMVGKHGEQLWIHGHCHNNSEFRVNGVDIIANPKGYYNENERYSPGLIVEV